MKRAIITTDNGTVSEYLEDQISALIVERKMEDFVKAVEYLRDHPELRVRLGQAAREAVLNGWDWKTRAEEHRAFFQNAINNRATFNTGFKLKINKSNDETIVKHKVFQTRELLGLTGLGKLDEFIRFLAVRFACSTILLITDIKSLDAYAAPPADTMAVITDTGFLLDKPADFVELIRSLLAGIKLVVLFDNFNPSFNRQTLEDLLETDDVLVEHVGCLINEFNKKVGQLALISSNGLLLQKQTPVNFRIVAVLSSYNEEDIIVPVIRHLNHQGIEVYLLDNWSTDTTYQKVMSLLGKGVIGLEKFPESGPSSTYDWEDILRRKEELCQQLDADWFIHHDVDEIRESPWEGVSFRDAIYRVDQEGYNAIDFTVLNFFPVDNGYQADTSFLDYFKYFEFGRNPAHLLQIRSWKKTPQQVDLHGSGGHNAEFSGRKVYPYKFILRHYPIRSQSHGETKILKERKERYNLKERKANWHNHYDIYTAGSNFLKDPAELMEFRPDFYADYLIERLSGVGLFPVKVNDHEEINDQILKRYVDHIAQEERVIAELKHELSEIKISKSWRMVLILRQARLILAPPESYRARLFQNLINFISSFFRKFRK